MNIALALGAVSALAVGLEAAAQSPLDAGAPAPKIPYVSALAGYRAFGEVETADWRRLNDTVGTIGGHAGSIGNAPSPTAGTGTDTSPRSTTPRGSAAPGATSAPAGSAVPARDAAGPMR